MITPSRRQFIDQLMLWGLMVTALSGSGCDNGQRSIRGPWYSGDFTVRSKFPVEIEIKEWKGFGFESPPGGRAGGGYPGGGAGASFGRISSLPSQTTVYWGEFDSNTAWKTQTIDLRGVVPRNTEGTTVFTLSEDGVWSVQFEPQPPDQE